jgi:hypothetical protein
MNSMWDEYLDALASYLDSVRDATMTRDRAQVSARLAARPTGPVPPAAADRLQSLRVATAETITMVEARRDEVARRLRSVRDRARPDTTRRAHCFDVEL